MSREADRRWAAKHDHNRMRWQRIREAEATGVVADSDEARAAIVDRIQSGEVSLEDGQLELRALKRDAKKNGKITRAQAALGIALPPKPTETT